MPTFVDILGDAGKYPDATEWTLPDGSKTTVGAERAKMKDAFMPKEDFTRGQQKAAAERQQLEQEYNQKLYAQQQQALALQQQLQQRTGNPQAVDELDAYLHDATFGPLARRLKQTMDMNQALVHEVQQTRQQIKDHENVWWLNQHAQVLRRLQDHDPDLKDTAKVQDFLNYAKNQQLPNLDLAYSLYTRDRDIARASEKASRDAYERAKTETTAPRVPTGTTQAGTTIEPTPTAPGSLDEAERMALNDPDIQRIMDGSAA